MNLLYKRAGMLGVAALTLGACEFGLGIDHSDDAIGVPAGTLITITNADEIPCEIPEGEETSPASVVVLSEATDDEEDVTPIVVETDSEGVFTTTVTAPSRPGHHMVIAICG